jgi:hypothetical protein
MHIVRYYQSCDHCVPRQLVDRDLAAILIPSIDTVDFLAGGHLLVHCIAGVTTQPWQLYTACSGRILWYPLTSSNDF